MGVRNKAQFYRQNHGNTEKPKELRTKYLGVPNSAHFQRQKHGSTEKARFYKIEPWECGKIQGIADCIHANTEKITGLQTETGVYGKSSAVQDRYLGVRKITRNCRLNTWEYGIKYKSHRQKHGSTEYGIKDRITVGNMGVRNKAQSHRRKHGSTE